MPANLDCDDVEEAKHRCATVLNFHNFVPRRYFVFVLRGDDDEWNGILVVLLIRKRLTKSTYSVLRRSLWYMTMIRMIHDDDQTTLIGKGFNEILSNAPKESEEANRNSIPSNPHLLAGEATSNLFALVLSFYSNLL